MTTFVEDALSAGFQPDAQLLDASEVRVPPTIATKLGIAESEKVVRIERVRFANDESISFDLTFLLLEIGREIVREDLQSMPIISLLEDKFGVKVDRSESHVEARLADRCVARALKIDTDRSILAIERVVFDRQGRAVDYDLMQFRGDRVRYFVRQDRKPIPHRSW